MLHHLLLRVRDDIQSVTRLKLPHLRNQGRNRLYEYVGAEESCKGSQDTLFFPLTAGCRCRTVASLVEPLATCS